MSWPSIEGAQLHNLGRPKKLYRQPGLVTPTSKSLPVIGAEQGRIDREHNDSIKRAITSPTGRSL